MVCDLEDLLYESEAVVASERCTIPIPDREPHRRVWFFVFRGNLPEKAGFQRRKLVPAAAIRRRLGF